MKKVYIMCPLCKDKGLEEECPTAAFQRVEGDKIYVYCCEHLAEKDKQE